MFFPYQLLSNHKMKYIKTVHRLENDWAGVLSWKSIMKEWSRSHLSGLPTLLSHSRF